MKELITSLFSIIKIMIKMMPHMFFFDRALLDAESLGHCIGLLQLKLLLLGV